MPGKGVPKRHRSAAGPGSHERSCRSVHKYAGGQRTATHPIRHERASRRADLTDPGECRPRDCSVGGVAHCRQLPSAAGWQPGRYRPRIDTFTEGVKLITDDQGPRSAVPPGRIGPGSARESCARHLTADRHPCDRRPGSAMTQRRQPAGPTFCSSRRTLALLMSWLGANLGANAGRHRATSGHIGPESSQVNGMPGDAWPRPATNRACMACKRPGVRIP
jgi:hypothetical protein